MKYYIYDIQQTPTFSLDMLNKIFKSNLTHSDEEIRLKAISKLSNTSKLINIIKEDKSFNCKLAALKKLEGVYNLIAVYELNTCKTKQFQDLLINKFVNNIEQTNNRGELSDIESKIRWATVCYAARDKLVLLTKAISDQDELFRIVKNESLYWVYNQAIYAINDENLLLRIIFETKETGSQSKRELAINQLIKILQDTNDQVKLVNYLETMSIPKVRAAAISNINDQAIIEKHALSDKDFHVRINAIKKLKDKNIILKMLDDENVDIIAEALLLIFDQSILANYATKDNSKKIRIASIKNIKDESFLTSIVSIEKDYEIRCAAVKNITNQGTLEKLALGDNDWLVRLYAVEKVDNPSVLEKYLLKDGNEFHSVEAVIERIHNQEILFSFVRDHHDKRVRQMALKNITDNLILGEIAKKYAEKGSQMGFEIKTEKHHYASNKFISTVISKISDQLVLQDIVFNSDYLACQWEAAYKIYDQKILASIFIECDEESIKRLVRHNLKGEDGYVYIAKKAKYPKDRIFAIENIDNEELLFEITKKEKEKLVRLEALKKINNSEMLSFIVKNDKDWDICLHALNSITNQEILSDFASNNTSSIIRTIAVKKLKVKSMLNRIAESDQDDSVRQIALEQLDNLL